MLLRVRKLKKHILVFTAVTVIAIGVLSTSTAVWASKNTPMVKAGDEQINTVRYAVEVIEKEKEVDLKQLEEFTKQLGEFKSVLTLETRLIAVSPSDERRFTPEEWQDILSKIEGGEMYWEDSEEFQEILRGHKFGVLNKN